MGIGGWPISNHEITVMATNRAVERNMFCRVVWKTFITQKKINHEIIGDTQQDVEIDMIKVGKSKYDKRDLIEGQ